MKRSPPDNSSNRPLRLMIHAADGCVPYLTPTTLETYFPPSDDFWVGMAVRDICVRPVFDKKSTERDAKKPRGYTFVGVEPDSWLLPYTRVTVPSFDLILDNERKKAKVGGTNTNNHVLVWTPNGRQRLTPRLYGEASRGMKSHYTLSLYDMDEEGSKRRLEKAQTRNKQWFQELSQTSQKDQSTPGISSTLWSPILLPKIDSEVPERFDQAHVDTSEIGGVALVGRWREGLDSALQNLKVPLIAVLSTQNFSEILSIACTNLVDVIGTELPTQWSKDKLALAVHIQLPDDSKRAKIDAAEKLALNCDGCIDLHDNGYERDPKPLLIGCTCLACKGGFSRSYIHHLVKAKELLAEILLFGHNLHHLLSVVRAFNSTNNREKLRDTILNQLGS